MISRDVVSEFKNKGAPHDVLHAIGNIAHLLDREGVSYYTCPTGSRVIGGAHTNSDWDFVIYSKDWTDVTDVLMKLEFVLGGSAIPDTHRSFSMKSYAFDGDINALVCKDVETYNRWCNATDVAKAFQLHDKVQRVALFEGFFNDTSFSESKGTKATTVGPRPITATSPFSLF